MPNLEPTLCLGKPRFDDAAQHRIAAESGDLAAWHAALSRDAPSAASGVSGDFAIALRDPSGRTFLAVDRFGMHSLCYRIDNGQLRFAARADELADASTPIDPQAVFDYLYFHMIPSPRTIFRGVQRLPAGHYALFEHGKLTVAPYWTPAFEEPRAPSFDALRAEFRALLWQAVKGQLDGSTPACFLSGGTDSSTVAGIIREVTGEPAASYSIGFDAEGYDEMSYARIAARAFGTRHHEYYVTPDDALNGIPRIAAYYDQPFGNSSALPAYYCAQLARSQGITRLLAGDGGDELFGGNSRYAKQRVFGWYARVPAALRHGVLEPVAGIPGVSRVPLLRKGASYVEQARVPMPDRLQMYNLLLRLGVADVLTPGFLECVDVGAPAKQQREVWRHTQSEHEINRTLAYDWRYTLAESDLPKVRGAAALADVGVSYPFLDRALVDFSMRLPVRYKLNGLKLRWFFKEALRGFLPDEIIAKKKHGFGLPFGVWATRHAKLQALALDSLATLADRRIVQRRFLDDLVATHLPAHPGYYGEMVWILMMLEQWLRAHRPDYAA
jgi:asparagine synthase (glutamine-hydrolysing)